MPGTLRAAVGNLAGDPDLPDLLLQNAPHRGRQFGDREHAADASAGRRSPKSHCDFTFLAMILSVGARFVFQRTLKRLKLSEIRWMRNARPLASSISTTAPCKSHAFGGTAKRRGVLVREAPDDRLDFPAQHTFMRPVKPASVR